MSSVIDPPGAIGLAATEREPAAAPARDPGTAPEPTVAHVIFALTPAQAVPDLYDYGKAKDAKIYKAATDPTTKYNGKAATDPLTTKYNGIITTLRPMLDEFEGQGLQLDISRRDPRQQSQDVQRHLAKQGVDS
ncbi:hypothetical protein MHU86_1321 [Fragilaria crotonensis]|nr:hypothetical protein MHU86_1321 [Fragilaria crotonensis]